MMMSKTSSETSEIPLFAPHLVLAQREPTDRFSTPSSIGVEVRTSAACLGLRVEVAALEQVSRVLLRWRRPIEPDALVLGDAWERSYGDLQWRGQQPERVLPWSMLVHVPATGTSWGFGVEVRGASFAFWTVDEEGLSLWLDLRSGGQAVRPGDRAVPAAVVRAVRDDRTPFAAQVALSRLLCRDPLPVGSIVGCNNWYYAYGRDFDAAAVLRDARVIADLVGDHPMRPFGVIDDGWSPDGMADGRVASGGPWDVGRPASFPDLSDVAAAIAAEGVRPGIWFRPLLTRHEPQLGSIGPRDGAFGLDPSHPATLRTVAEDVARLRAWGFELIKHDFSTYDLLGRWGPDFAGSPAPDGLRLADPTRTTAEVLVDFYTTVHEAAGGAVIIGCNVVGHLAAGLVEVQRTGDDVSGLVWGRTRRTGVNTLAFRLAQHGAFFTVDADCVPSTPVTDWSLNRRFLDLVSRSGTALFVSVDPTTRTDAVDADLSVALRRALDGGQPGGVEPLDWLQTTSPSRWRCGEQEIRYDWLEPWGGDPFEQEQTDATAHLMTSHVDQSLTAQAIAQQNKTP